MRESGYFSCHCGHGTLVSFVTIHIMKNLSWTHEELFDQLKEYARSQGALTRDAWDDAVESFLEDKHEFQEIADNADWQQIIDGLKAKYEEFRGEVGVM